MVRRRKWDLIGGCSIFVMLSLVYAVLFVALVTLTISDPIETKILPIILVALSLPLYYWCLYYAAIHINGRALKHGVVLTEDALFIYGFEISMKNILKVEVADFASGSHFLAIGYIHDTGKKKNTKTRLMWPEGTEDIWELCDRIGELKGWSEQEKVRYYGFFGWGRWKALVKELA
jgi:hypothetical protein